MSTRAIVLGAGLVGATMAHDLADDAEFAVTVADIGTDRLARFAGDTRVRTIQADLSDPDRVRTTVRDFDIVLGALPSRIGFQTLEAVIAAGKSYCDISFMPQDALALDGLAKRQGVTAVVDCGVSPGLSNMIVGHVVSRLDRADEVVIYVGGLPKVRRWPYQYKAPFAPLDVIEEYTRPARMVENGRIVVKPALSEAEPVEFAQVGTLEAFNTDGLRSLLTTVEVANLREKTLRYPGHAELMRVLRETGFLSNEEVRIGGTRVRPLDVTAHLLFPKWAYEPNEEEFTVLRVVAEGVEHGRRVRHVYELYDEFDAGSGTSSMARTTAYPCCIVARMLARGGWVGPGVVPPENLVRQNGAFEHVVRELAARGVSLTAAVQST